MHRKMKLPLKVDKHYSKNINSIFKTRKLLYKIKSSLRKRDD